MGDFLIVSHAPEDGAAGALALALRQTAKTNRVVVSDLSPVCWLGVAGPRPPRVVVAGNWHLIGDTLNRHKPRFDGCASDDPWSYEKKLISRFWGRFVGLSLDGNGVPEAVLRDPSGGLDCFVWTAGGLTCVASHVPPWLVDCLRPDWQIAFDRVAAALRDPLLASDTSLLEGLSSVLPGTLQPLPQGRPVVLWQPGLIAERNARDTVPQGLAAARLRGAVEEAVQGLLSVSKAAAIEISGGLDSSIVAASVGPTSRSRIRAWLNAYGPDSSADERGYASDLAAHLNITPTFVARATGKVTQDLLDTMPHGVRPALAALDGLHDADWASRFRAAGVDAVLTGKGGDSLFIQPADAMVFQDLWHADGWRALGSPALLDLSRWSERSAWSLISQAVRRPAPERNVNELLQGTSSSPVSRHPWMNELDHLAPGKAYQIAGLVNALQFHGRSLQTEAADVLHPLLALPVVEACLALSTPVLTCGRRDRGLARLAYSERLPPSIIQRRSKGEMTAFYGHMIADGLDVLRPWILDGRLAAEGLIDRDRASALLTRDSLIWKGGYVEIMLTAAFEGWVRHWDALLAVPTVVVPPASRTASRTSGRKRR